MSQRLAWTIEDDFELVFKLMEHNHVKAGSKEGLKQLAAELPGQRTPKAISRRLQKLQYKYQIATKKKTDDSPTSVLATPKSPKSSRVAKAKPSPLKGKKGKKVGSPQLSTPSQGDGEMNQNKPSEPRVRSARRGSKKNYAEIDMSESDGVERDEMGGITFENVEIKTE
ncbi:hypothetical protein IWX49DRAFT_555790 [Phyllosticta citricarpa]|uniref:Uncharacterized protein n=1 Tax=Phyllosticta paracitricarpa TaxID=2016321 RepID=A0ABR1MX93_9PEZI